MIKNLSVAFLLLSLAGACSRPSITVDSYDGHICSYIQRHDTVRFRSDGFRGPAFEGVQLKADGSRFTGIKDSLEYSLSYSLCSDHIVIKAGITNLSESDRTIGLRERLILGVDTEMLSFPQWDSVFFPTLLRCEKDFAWGYFSSTDGSCLAFATEEPVASYGINYLYEDDKEWKWGHTIRTASLDLMHTGPLPERHPQHLDRISAGQALEWTLHLGLVDGTDKVKSAVSRWAGVPMVELGAYTVPVDTEVKMRVCRGSRNVVLTPSGDTVVVKGSHLPEFSDTGLYRVVSTLDGRSAEASLFVRPDWNWYADAARASVAANLPRMGNSCEAYYGYLPALSAARRNPNPALDSVIFKRLEQTLSVMVDTATGTPKPDVLPDRVQNFSTLAVILGRYWQADGDLEYLRVAGRIADYLTGMQSADGAYRSHGIHYTAVIYPAKSLIELSEIERSAGFEEAASRHYDSAMRACLDLASRLDNIETEGDITFEDGMITCSALQMAYAAMHTDDAGVRKTLTDAAEYMMRKHRCLEQNLIPDCRMRGATLRWWEALDIYFSPNQVMNSPHGWSAWKAYADAYLYKLTGKKEYLKSFEDLMGACVQVMDLNGRLRWGFIPDPYVDGCVCVPGPEPYTWTVRDSVVGEQYMDMISPWCRAENELVGADFGESGGSGDCTVYEIFNALEELVLAGGCLE